MSKTKRKIRIIKGSGEEAIFSKKRIFVSLRRAGANRDVAARISDAVAKQVKAGMTTKQIYRKAFSMLKRSEQPVIAARYSLKQAIMELGPTGYPFELFLGALLSYDGFNVQTGQVLKGKCVTHEVDVVAKKGNKKILIEAKFHNTRGYTTDVKVPLYIHSRYQDIKAAHKGKASLEQWIVTNTRFSQDATIYGECVGLTMIGWRYPETGGLETLVEKAGLHPITCLTTLSKQQKQQLLKRETVLCKDLVEKRKNLLKLGLSKSKVAAVVAEASQLCFGSNTLKA